jgi:hypothetical protein
MQQAPVSTGFFSGAGEICWWSAGGGECPKEVALGDELRYEGFVCALDLNGIERNEDRGEDASDDALPWTANAGSHRRDEEGKGCGKSGGDGSYGVGLLREEVGKDEGKGDNSYSCEVVDGELGIGEGQVGEADFGDEDDGAGEHGLSDLKVEFK